MGDSSDPMLFDETALRGVQPTGSPWRISNDDPATVPVPLQVLIKKVEGPYTAKDRKLWTFLLHVAFDRLGKEQIHSIPVRDINHIFRETGGEHGTEWIWESAKRLSQTTIEFEETMGDERFLGVTSIFGAKVPAKAKRGSDLYFHFPPLLIPIIKEPLRFARLRVHFLLKLSGKYAVSLYEILEGYANRRDSECRVSIDDLRIWLKVPDGTYLDWKDLRKWVIDPAIKQINDDPLGAGFSVTYAPIRKGRFYHEIIFRMTKTDGRKRAERALQDASALRQAKDTAADAGRPYLGEAAIRKAREATRYVLDMEEVQRQFWTHWETTGRPKFQKGVEQAFIGFSKHKAKQLT